MEYVFFGSTGMRVSKLALGTMSFGGAADESQATKMFADARDAGINLFDCADVYNGGAAEKILGKLVRECRDDVVLTTKAYFTTGQGPNDRGTSRYHLMQAVDASLRRLKTDRIDVFFLHRFDDNAGLEETLRAVDDLVTQGKILYPAVSNFAAWQTSKALGVARAHGWAPIVCIQPMYNAVKRQAEVEILPMAEGEGIAVMPYSPTAGGLLTGRYGKDSRAESGRLVDDAMYATRYGGDEYFRAASDFVELAKELSVHPVTLAIAWVAAHPAVTSPLLGARNTEQLAPALAAAEFELSTEAYDRIASMWPTPPPATDRNEEDSANNYAAALSAKAK